MEDLHIPISLGEVYAKAAGQPGSPLILGIHGWSARNGWHSWAPLMEPLAAAGCYVVCVDMPGWGNSARLVEKNTMMGQTAVNLTCELMDQLSADPVVLMGKSWGGGVALAAALARPMRVSRLILTAPAWQDVDALRDLDQPVLLAWAKDDPMIPFDSAGQFIKTVPHIQFEPFESGGHSAAMNNAERFAPKAVAFLAAN